MLRDENNGGRRVTRRDVAAAAGVSLTTVTHALNPKPGTRMNAETRDRVCKVAKELGYRPSFVGRALVSGRTYTVGLLQPTHEVLFSEFYQQMVYGMLRAMEDDDYSMLILFRSRENRWERLVSQGRVDGMLVLQSDAVTDHVGRLAELGLPSVVVNKGVPTPSGGRIGCVHSDHRQMMSDAVGAFAELGCRSLVALHNPDCSDANRQMHEGFTQALSDRAGEGVTGATLAPDRDHFRRQVRGMLADGVRWDGVLIDGVGLADDFVAEAKQIGLVAGTDYQLITTDCRNGALTSDSVELVAYTHQAELVGQEAWSLLRGLIRGESQGQTHLVPYRRVAPQPSPCVSV